MTSPTATSFTSDFLKIGSYPDVPARLVLTISELWNAHERAESRGVDDGLLTFLRDGPMAMARAICATRADTIQGLGAQLGCAYLLLDIWTSSTGPDEDRDADLRLAHAALESAMSVLACRFGMRPEQLGFADEDAVFDRIVALQEPGIARDCQQYKTHLPMWDEFCPVAAHWGRRATLAKERDDEFATGDTSDEHERLLSAIDDEVRVINRETDTARPTSLAGLVMKLRDAVSYHEGDTDDVGFGKWFESIAPREQLLFYALSDAEHLLGVAQTFKIPGRVDESNVVALEPKAGASESGDAFVPALAAE
jgi:hypothetical protein